jgi:hypothetical protein
MSAKRPAAKAKAKSPARKQSAAKKAAARKTAAKKAPAKRTWQQLEKLMAMLHKQLAPDAEVHHDYHITGKSGDVRKLDVAIIRSLALNRVLLPIDCKQHKRRVSRKDVAGFADQVDDVGANVGVMISASGFDSGARKLAAQKNVILKTYRQAEQTDWETFLTSNSWLALTTTDVENLKASVSTVGGAGEEQVPLETVFEGGDKPVEDVFKQWWQRQGPPQEIGHFKFAVRVLDGPKFSIIKGEESRRIEELFFEFDIVARKYNINIRELESEILERQREGEADGQELITFLLDHEDIMQRQPFVELTPEEFERDREILMLQNLTGRKRPVRVAIVKEVT